MTEEIKFAGNSIIATGICSGIIGALLTIICNHRLSLWRERKNGAANRKRSFLAFMQQWKHEIDRWHFGTGGFSRHENVVFDLASTFVAEVESIRRDFSVKDGKIFEDLVSAISSRATGRYAYKHDELIKAVDEIISFVDCHI